MKNVLGVDAKMRASFFQDLKALAPLPVPLALPRALGLTVALESPPPVDRRLDQRH